MSTSVSHECENCFCVSCYHTELVCKKCDAYSEIGHKNVTKIELCQKCTSGERSTWSHREFSPCDIQCEATSHTWVEGRCSDNDSMPWWSPRICVECGMCEYCEGRIIILPSLMK